MSRTSKDLKSPSSSVFPFWIVAGVAILAGASYAWTVFHNDDKEQDNDFGSNAKETNNDRSFASQDNMQKSPINDQVTATSPIEMTPIGHVESIYRLCVGTPRQGLLAPSSRGRIILHGDFASASDSIDGIQEYSHIWVLFVFHLNTKKASLSKLKNKISPPALGGQRKVGMYATRTPHRRNPIGLTLCRVEDISIHTLPSTDNTTKQKHKKRVSILVSGIDLVDGTPVLDIKPYVPHYDAPIIQSTHNLSQQEQQQENHEQNYTRTIGEHDSEVRLPSWVKQGLSRRRKVVLPQHVRHDFCASLEQLRQGTRKKLQILEFYDCSQDNDLESIFDCIIQVMSVDVRSVWQTQKARKGQFQAQTISRVAQAKTTMALDGGKPEQQNQQIHQGDQNQRQLCTQQLDNLLIHYTMEPPSEKEENLASSALDVITIESIELMQSNIHNITQEHEKQDQQATTIIPKADTSSTSETLMSERQGDNQETVVDVTAEDQGKDQPDKNDENVQEGVDNENVQEGILTNDRKSANDDEKDVEILPLHKSQDQEEDEEEEDDDNGYTVVEMEASTAQGQADEKTEQQEDTGTEESDDNLPIDGDYSSLKNYWSQAATKHTPKGLLPDEDAVLRRSSSTKYFTPQTNERNLLQTKNLNSSWKVSQRKLNFDAGEGEGVEHNNSKGENKNK